MCEKGLRPQPYLCKQRGIVHSTMGNDERKGAAHPSKNGGRRKPAMSDAEDGCRSKRSAKREEQSHSKQCTVRELGDGRKGRGWRERERRKSNGNRTYLVVLGVTRRNHFSSHGKLFGLAVPSVG